MQDLNKLSLPELYRELASLRVAGGGTLVRRLFELARDEDLGEQGDVTTLVFAKPGSRCACDIVARGDGVVAGLEMIPEVLSLMGGGTFRASAHDGDRIKPGQSLGRLEGESHAILAAERSILNLLGRLSGVATRTARFVGAMGSGVRAGLFDTRKTTPGLRVLEKYAVRCGGGMCHRLGLHDAVLLKDNHLAGVSDADLGRFVTEAAARAREACAACAISFFEVEVDRLEQFESILAAQRGAATAAKVDIVLLDNMGPELLAKAVAMRDRSGLSIELEASGGVREETIRAIALSGVDRISAGTLTHGATWVDFGLDAVT
ncbi:MAG: carboxylating nicotinate-nucleotide diphosphorylase [Phycisphaerae bacterium]|nr:carboxylating nicotinate-nucleotide diphosphorylase [Phycisphaerae bacterium]